MSNVPALPWVIRDTTPVNGGMVGMTGLAQAVPLTEIVGGVLMAYCEPAVITGRLLNE